MQDINKTGSILFVVGKSPMDIMGSLSNSVDEEF